MISQFMEDGTSIYCHDNEGIKPYDLAREVAHRGALGALNPHDLTCSREDAPVYPLSRDFSRLGMNYI